MRKAFSTLSALILPVVLLTGPVMAQAPSAEARQQELLRIWYEIREGVAAKGDVDAKFDVAVANFVARGTPQDHARALHWFERAANLGHAGAHYYLGYMYAAGVGTDPDPRKSTQHYVSAAELGHPEAQYMIGSRYANGEGLPRDANEADKWMARAAEQGVPGAQFYMGQVFELGQPAARSDAQKAVQLYRAAATQGYGPAQTRLGELYLSGRGVGRDLEEAYLWFSLAQAPDRVDEVRRQMSRAQLAAAEDRVRSQLAALNAQP